MGQNQTKLLRQVSKHGVENDKSSLQKMFQKYDKDKSNSLEGDEIDKFLGDVYDFMSREGPVDGVDKSSTLKLWISYFDQDGNKVLDWTEFSVALDKILTGSFHINDALMNAIKKGSMDMVKTAIQAGADVNFESREYPPALHQCVREKRWDIFKLVLEYGGETNYPTLGSPPHYPSGTPLSYLLTFHSKWTPEILDVANKLLTFHCKPKIEDVMIAVKNDNTQAIKLFFTHYNMVNNPKLKPDLNHSPDGCITPLTEAKSEEMKKLLREYGAT
eukprot:TRINITY_DN4465_c0_g5_i1.p1 TRINITY_DN4465_c0_g5~~TRINITY_DN4465_c0_g5_i1.p1  ORF type:complete len:274 (-),score=43.30 TRINITY_DN4465_c0_g5_i1:134-955(-)